MKTAQILAVFALASISLAGCALAPSDVNKDGTEPAASASAEVPTPSSTADVNVAPPAAPSAPAVVTTTTATTPKGPSPGTLASCYDFDVATLADGSTVGVCNPTTATGKPKYLRAYSIVSVVSPVTGENTSILVGIE